MAESHATGPGAVEHLTEALTFVDDPLARADITQMLGRVMLFTGDPDGAADVTRAAMAGLPADAEEVRRSLEALVHMTVYFGAGDPASLAVLEPYRRVIPGAGLGTRLLQSMAAYTWAYQGGSADECTAVCLDCLLDGEMVAFDSALLPLAAMNSSSRPDARRSSTSGSTSGPRRTARARCSSSRRSTSGTGTRCTAAESSTMRARCSRRRSTRSQRWGFGPLVQVYPAAHLAMVHARARRA